MKNTQLQNLQQYFPKGISDRIEEVLKEEEAYAADELVELCEAILNELAAVGFAVYLKQEKQKTVYNDFLIQLFTARSHAFNAGPLYRWAANMVRDLKTPEAKQVKGLFWEKDGKTLREEINALSLLRNKVMHGFFVLPPETNREEADKIARVLEELNEIELFSTLNEGSLHFLNKTDVGISFSGSWKITEHGWEQLKDTYECGKIAKAIRFQLSEAFETAELNKVQAQESRVSIENITALFKDRTKGAFAIWMDAMRSDSGVYNSLVQELLEKEEYLPVFYELNADGITFESDFLLSKMIAKLSAAMPATKYSSDKEKAIETLAEASDKQIIVVLNNIHIALFHPEHLLKLADLFYDNNILLVGFGHHHPWLDRYFNNSLTLLKQPRRVGAQWRTSLDNYLRFKGPSREKEDERKEYELLVKIGEQLVDELLDGKEIYARRFADDNNFPIEYVHELFGVLHPYFKSNRKPFKEDVVDELYGFPKELEESSLIYLSIGRRDARLEYKHKTLSYE